MHLTFLQNMFELQ